MCMVVHLKTLIRVTTFAENPNANFVAEGYQVTCDGKVATDAHDLLSGDKTYVVSKIAQ